MYEKCFKDDQEKFWSLITDSKSPYWYCKYIKDRPEVYKFITESKWAYVYCRDVKNRLEVRKFITNSVINGVTYVDGIKRDI